jgi:feruloyl-CoA synthase
VLDAPLRPVRFFSPEVELIRQPGGSLLMQSAEPLASYDHRIGGWLDRWARESSDRDFLVEQTLQGERRIRYGEARESALALAENLLGYNLGPDRPLAILAANGIDHALIMLAALYVGIPVAPIAPAYAL